jgi:histidinol-phosphate aminotransferase
MSLSRRGFVRTVAGARHARADFFLAARGHEAWSAEHRLAYQAGTTGARQRPTGIRLNSNENPLGPSDAAKAAIEKAFAYAGRYPMNARPAMADFRALVAKKHGVKVESVSLGAGSGEILENAVQAFTTGTRGLVAAMPTFEAPSRTAKERNVPLNEVPVDADGKLDLERMIAAASGAGLVFVCNPNNPTATVHSGRAIADLVARIHKTSPDAMILIDEAYHDYVMDSAYASSIPLIAGNPAVIVSRTMSKLHGMAGLRLGYAVGHPDAIARLSRWSMPYNGNALAVAAACVSIEDAAQIERERRRNVEALKFTSDFFRQSGFPVTDSQANFVWVNLNRPAKEFREACEKQGILVARDFPPFEKTHCRISVGTMDEMRRAVAVFRSVLGVTTTTAQRRQGA